MGFDFISYRDGWNDGILEKRSRSRHKDLDAQINYYLGYAAGKQKFNRDENITFEEPGQDESLREPKSQIKWGA